MKCYQRSIDYDKKGENKVHYILCLDNIYYYISTASTRIDTIQIYFHVWNKFAIFIIKKYIYEKQKRVKFVRVGKKNKSEQFKLAPFNLWGPTHVPFVGGFYYYVTFIDDATRKLGFISIQKNLMYLKSLRNEKLWFRMRMETS